MPERYAKGAFWHERTLFVEPGAKVSVYASGVKGARFLAFSPDNTLYVTSPSEGNVYALPDVNADGVADDVFTFVSGLYRPHGIAFFDNELIVAENSRITAFRDDNKDMIPDSRRTITKDLPSDNALGFGHWTRTVVVGPDKRLYVSAGSSCNACVESDKRRATIVTVPAKGGNTDVFAKGLRNSVGIAFHPITKELWAVDNGRDWLGDDLPPEELNLVQRGKDYGWPRCYGVKVPDPELGSIEACKKTTAPEAVFQAHSAPLGVAFHTDDKGRGERLFVAFHGSWNRSSPVGYKLMAVPFKDGRPSAPPKDVITGWLTEDGAWGRPVGLVVGPDNALYLSDDYAGAIYRIAFD